MLYIYVLWIIDNLVTYFWIVNKFADGPSDDWTVPSYLAWPTALWRVFAHWIALLPVLFDSLKLDGVKQVRLTPEAPDSNHTLTWHSGLLYCGAGDYFLGLAGWVWSGRQGEVRSWSWVMMELESASNRGELGAVGDSLQPQTPSRHEKSLGLLTTKFVTLLQEAKDGVLDLKAVSMQLEAFCC